MGEVLFCRWPSIVPAGAGLVGHCADPGCYANVRRRWDRRRVGSRCGEQVHVAGREEGG